MKKEFKLPQGAAKIKPRTCKIGNWLEMTFDARVVRCGVEWLRVKDGMSGRGDREDWVANIQAPICISIHHYQWSEDLDENNFWPEHHGSFDNACKAELKESLDELRRRLMEAQKDCRAMEAAIKLISNEPPRTIAG